MTIDHRLVEVLELAESLCLDQMTADRQARLKALLSDDVGLRRAYIRYVHMHVCLRRAFRQPQPDGDRDVLRSPKPSAGSAPPPRSPRRITLPTALAIVVVVLGLTATILWWARHGGELNQQKENRVVATLTQSRLAVWEMANAPDPGTELNAGRLVLREGIAEITFAGGAVAVIEGPSNLELEGPNRGFLHVGRVVARIAGTTTGFVIETDKARLVDLGTEFGVEVTTAGATLVQVFEGVVVAELKEKDKASHVSRRLKSGETLQIDAPPDSSPREVPNPRERFVRKFPAAGDRGADWLKPYNESRFDTIDVVPASPKPVIDGDLADWDKSGGFQSQCHYPFEENYFVEGYMMFDMSFLYIGAHIGDPAPMRSTIDPDVGPNTGSLGWQGGSLQVRVSTDRRIGWPVDAQWLDEAGNLSQRPQDFNEKLVHLTLWYFQPKEQACLHLSYGMNWHGGVANPVGFSGAFRKDADGRGYTLEYAIPWKLLNAESDPPQAGDTLAASWNVHWADDEGKEWKGHFLEIKRPDVAGLTYQQAATWGRAVYRMRGHIGK